MLDQLTLHTPMTIPATNEQDLNPRSCAVNDHLCIIVYFTDRPDPIVFLSVTVSTSGHVYDDFVRLLFLHSYCEASTLAGELPEKSEHFRFLRTAHVVNLKGSVVL